jgi:hypothetical protein
MIKDQQKNLARGTTETASASGSAAR